MPMSTQVQEVWELASGTWRPSASSSGFEPVTTRLGHAAASVSAADLQLLLCLPWLAEDASALFPPEFLFDPEWGRPLRSAPVTAPHPTWLPPFGQAPHVRLGDVNGLCQTSQPLQLAGTALRRQTDSADQLLKPPAAGDFEFFSVPAGTAVPVLLALEPGKGLLYAWLPDSRQWALLTHARGHLLACCRKTLGMSWRAEVGTGAAGCSHLFIPTEEGLACLTPDVPGLAFTVGYVGRLPSIGAPIQWMGRIWVPLRATGGAVQFACCDLEGRAGDGVVLETAELPLVLNAMQAPVADARRAMWLGDAGRLELHRRTTGTVDAVFVPWPADLKPAFEFGSPYLASDGELWQLCRNASRRSYEYLSLAPFQEARMPALQPRMGTGGVNFRFARRQRTPPWEEPEHGHDGTEVEIVLPMLESTASRSILGLRLENTSGLAGMLRSTERVRAVLVLDEGTRQTAFFTLNVAMPWRLRWFVHGGMLWAFHAQLQQIHGWELQA